MMKTLNLFLGFAFVIFGYSALNMIPEFKNYLGQELVGWWIFLQPVFLFIIYCMGIKLRIY